jgi:hypothetical protein
MVLSEVESLWPDRWHFSTGEFKGGSFSVLTPEDVRSALTATTALLILTNVKVVCSRVAGEFVTLRLGGIEALVVPVFNTV